MEGITAPACRSIFLDWALGVPDDANATEEIARLLAIYAGEDEDHPMKQILRAGLADTGLRRRGRRSGRYRQSRQNRARR